MNVSQTVMWVNRVALVASGLYAGGCLTVALVDIPYVATLAEPGPVFAAMLALMGRMMLPLVAVLLLAFSGASALAWRRGERGWIHLPLLVFLAIVVITLVEAFPMNSQFLAVVPPAGHEARLLLARWAQWHAVRTALAVIQFVAALKLYPR